VPVANHVPIPTLRVNFKHQAPKRLTFVTPTTTTMASGVKHVTSLTHTKASVYSKISIRQLVAVV
jgi:hypothetical protein